MIQDSATERFRCGRQPARCPAIIGAGRRIATRVIVSEDKSGAAVNRRVGDDRAQGKRRAALIASVAGDVEAARLVVDMRDPQALATRIGVGEAPGEEAARRFQPVEFQRQFGTLNSHGRRVGGAGAASYLNRVRTDPNINRCGAITTLLVRVRSAYRDSLRCSNIST
jgi:hypothetical protein